MLTDDQFDRARRLALRLAGIELVERHRELLYRRTCRSGLEAGARLDALLAAAEVGDAAARRRLIGLLTTSFTEFFRHPSHFSVAAEHARLVAQKRGTARLWSAAAATGEEPYSLAMALIEAAQRDDPGGTILATDIDTEALAIAAAGEYSEPALRMLTSDRRQRFFGEVAGAARWRINPAPRRLVEFREVNLTEPIWPVAGPFDVIFSRNVLMYLEVGRRQAVLERLAALLAPDGLLILDPVEHLGKAAPRFTSQTQGVYQLAHCAGSGGRGRGA